MTKKIGLLFPFRPKFNRIRQCVDCLTMTSNERAAEIDVLEIMLLGLQISNLTNVVAAADVSNGSSDAVHLIGCTGGKPHLTA